MVEIDELTLAAAIEAVEAQVWQRYEQIDACIADGDDPTDLEDELMPWVAATGKLRMAYEQAGQAAANLPPYHQLVPRSFELFLTRCRPLLPEEKNGAAMAGLQAGFAGGKTPQQAVQAALATGAD